jgi:hypothetical protein
VIVANDFGTEDGPGESAAWAQGLIRYIESLPDDDARLVVIAALVPDDETWDLVAGDLLEEGTEVWSTAEGHKEFMVIAVSFANARRVPCRPHGWRASKARSRGSAWSSSLKPRADRDPRATTFRRFL